MPYAPVQSRADWAASETVSANNLLHRTRDADHGDMVVPDVPVELSLTPGSVEWEAATLPMDGVVSGEHNRARSAPTLGAVEPRKLPLDGVVVVDTTKFLAGPFGGQLLHDLGATVIKIEPEGGEEFRAVAGATYSVLNRNKPQVVLDLTAPADRDAFSSLVQRSDVLMENMSQKVVDKLHLDLAQLRVANPDLVHCHIDAWGPGPLDDSPGFDPLLQARSGLMAAQGGLETPVIQAMSVHDIGTGTLAAFGVVAALYARTRLGVGQQVRAALSRTSIAFQGAEFTTFAGRTAPTVGHLDYIGDSPAHRLYSCTDGWIAVSATADTDRAAFEQADRPRSRGLLHCANDGVGSRRLSCCWCSRGPCASEGRHLYERRRDRQRVLLHHRRRGSRTDPCRARLLRVGGRATARVRVHALLWS